jgi:hypothetical protein
VRARKTAGKHGGGAEKVQLVDALAFSREKSKDRVALDEGLKRLELPCRRAKAVLWSCASFGGLEMDEIAELEGVSIRTVKGLEPRSCLAAP